MTHESLNKGIEIQDALSALRNELTYLENEKRPVLSFCTNSCDKETYPLLLYIEKQAKKFLRDLVQKKIAQLEKEFKAL